MRNFLTILVACAALLVVPELAQAQAKKDQGKGAGMTCAQRCQKFCEGKHHNCFDRCSTLRCNR